jgi:hypothetical protein
MIEFWVETRSGGKGRKYFIDKPLDFYKLIRQLPVPSSSPYMVYVSMANRQTLAV